MPKRQRDIYFAFNLRELVELLDQTHEARRRHESVAICAPAQDAVVYLQDFDRPRMSVLIERGENAITDYQTGSGSGEKELHRHRRQVMLADDESGWIDSDWVKSRTTKPLTPKKRAKPKRARRARRA